MWFQYIIEAIIDQLKNKDFDDMFWYNKKIHLQALIVLIVYLSYEIHKSIYAHKHL